MAKRRLFGTDGIRGRANIYPMTGELAMALGRAVTHYFQTKERGRSPLIIIGKDTRLSCYMLEQAFASGVCSQGGRAILTGPLPTPGVAFVTQSMRADAGVMISASHNAFYDNGIKIFDRLGNKLPDEVEMELENMILNPDLIPTKVDEELGRAKRLEEVHGRYVVHVKSSLGLDFDFTGMRLIVDGANGATYRVAPMVFEELGAEVVAIGNNPNGHNINLNCGSLHPELCADMVAKFRADLGICLDGDGDRLTMINENAEVVDGDKLIGVLARYFLESGQMKLGDEVVGTIMSNMGLEVYLRSLGLGFYRTKVGDRYILEYMKKSNAQIGGEPSGHIIFRRHATTGDGILAAMKVIEAVRFFRRPLHELTAEVPSYPQIIKNIKVQNKVPFEDVPEITSELHRAQQVLGDKGRVILRYSGTESVARVMVEGEKTAVVNELCEKLALVVTRALN